MLTLIAEESARQLLDDPVTYDIKRLMSHADWFLKRFV